MKHRGLSDAEVAALFAVVAVVKLEARKLEPGSRVRGALLAIGSNLSRALGEDRLRRHAPPRARRARLTCRG